MLDYLISGANVMCLAGCIYIAYLIVQVKLFRSYAAPKHGRATGDREADDQYFRNPCLDYYI